MSYNVHATSFRCHWKPFREPEHLLAAEVEAFIQCREHHWLLEQERIPQGYVIQSILN